MSPTVDLPDLNVRLALACPDHGHHREAVHYWEQQAAEQMLFCTVTALGLVRLVCQPKRMAGTCITSCCAAVRCRPVKLGVTIQINVIERPGAVAWGGCCFW